MRVLVACESSGVVRDAFIREGHDAISCDILPTETPGPHLTGDILEQDVSGFDLMVAHPPCTYLSVSGLHWNKRIPERERETQKAIAFFMWFVNCPIKKKAIENPVGCISSVYRKPDQIIQPYDFGENASKKTCLWLFDLPKLVLLDRYPPRIVSSGPFTGKERWANQTDSGQNNLGPSEDRWKERSKTYDGIARAMATQWGNGLLS